MHNELAKSYGATQGQFNIAPAISFLRLHQPDKFGDDLSSFRPTVLAANREKRPISGSEKGKGGYGIRGVVPVTYQGQQVGSFEIGMDFDKAFLQGIKDSYGGDISIYLHENSNTVQTFQEESQKKSNSAFTLYASTGMGGDESRCLENNRRGSPAEFREASFHARWCRPQVGMIGYSQTVARDSRECRRHRYGGC